jgi:hypothetical protein
MKRWNKEYKVGDKVWYHKGTLLVLCTIVGVDDAFRKKYPKAVLYYWLDEPIGHHVDAEELYSDFKEAKKDLKMFVKNTREAFEELGRPFREDSLPLARKQSARFILSTHLKGKKWGKRELVVRKKMEEFLKSYPPKKKGVEWFSGKEMFT